MTEDATPYIKSAKDKITKPAICAETGKEINLSSGDIVYLNKQHRPIHDDSDATPTYVATVQHAIGCPWNGIHPETGETQAFESNLSWWNLNDKKEL